MSASSSPLTLSAFHTEQYAYVTRHALSLECQWPKQQGPVGCCYGLQALPTSRPRVLSRRILRFSNAEDYPPKIWLEAPALECKSDASVRRALCIFSKEAHLDRKSAKEHFLFSSSVEFVTGIPLWSTWYLCTGSSRRRLCHSVMRCKNKH